MVLQEVSVTDYLSPVKPLCPQSFSPTSPACCPLYHWWILLFSLPYICNEFPHFLEAMYRMIHVGLCCEQAWEMSLYEQHLCHQTAVPSTPLSYYIREGKAAGHSQPQVTVVSPPFLSHPDSSYFYSPYEVLGSLKWKQSVARSNSYKGWSYKG